MTVLLSTVAVASNSSMATCLVIKHGAADGQCKVRSNEADQWLGILDCYLENGSHIL